MIAILNHMPVWAGASIIGAIVTGYFLGAWWTRDEVERGYRRYWWWPW